MALSGVAYAIETLRGRFESAGLAVTDICTHRGTARWRSIDEMVQIEVESTPLADQISNDIYRG